MHLVKFNCIKSPDAKGNTESTQMFLATYGYDDIILGLLESGNKLVRIEANFLGINYFPDNLQFIACGFDRFTTYFDMSDQKHDEVQNTDDMLILLRERDRILAFKNISTLRSQEAAIRWNVSVRTIRDIQGSLRKYPAQLGGPHHIVVNESVAQNEYIL
ncbi:MAG: hypothetical protein EZS28_019947 [Streblomastix strix]|uniref:Uncharacterized protein n=1 Tax=Streblomastix strix TaxID=222440 RepID=A0A5J4VPW1_9EUKA|nr:MAG: hypothetical protein EZS28_019947 [Streblomastix strix]